MAWLVESSGAGCRSPLRSATATLRRNDPVLGRIIARVGPCRLVASRPTFPVLLEAVVSQQVSTHAARAIYERLLSIMGRRVPRPADVLRLGESRLRSAGLSRAKVGYVRAVAEAFKTGRFRPSRLAGLGDTEISAALCDIRGIGEWSAHMFLIFALARLDVLPLGDLGLRTAMAAAYQLGERPGLDELRIVADVWRPYRTLGTWYMWKSYDNA